MNAQSCPWYASRLHTFAAEYSTTFLSTKSDLLPMMSFFTSSDAYRSISCIHPLTFLNVSRVTARWRSTLSRLRSILPEVVAYLRR